MREKRELSDYTLEELQKSFDPYFTYSDDYSVYEKHRLISLEIHKRTIKDRENKLDKMIQEAEKEKIKLDLSDLT